MYMMKESNNSQYTKYGLLNKSWQYSEQLNVDDSSQFIKESVRIRSNLGKGIEIKPQNITLFKSTAAVSRLLYAVLFMLCSKEYNRTEKIKKGSKDDQSYEKAFVREEIKQTKIFQLGENTTKGKYKKIFES